MDTDDSVNRQIDPSNVLAGLEAAASKVGVQMNQPDRAVATFLRMSSRGGPGELAVDCALDVGHGQPWESLTPAQLDAAWMAFQSTIHRTEDEPK